MSAGTATAAAAIASGSAAIASGAAEAGTAAAAAAIASGAAEAETATAAAVASGSKRVQALMSKKRYALIESGFKAILKGRCLPGQEDETLGALLMHIQETMQFDPHASTYAARDPKKISEAQKERNATMKKIATLLRSQLKDGG